MAQQEQQIDDQLQQQEIVEDVGHVAANLIAVLETDGIKAGVSPYSYSFFLLGFLTISSPQHAFFLFISTIN